MCKTWMTPVVTLLFTATMADSAQAQEIPTAEIVGGYSALAHRADFDATFPRGWFAGAGWNVTDRLAIVGEISGNQATGQLSFFNQDSPGIPALRSEVYAVLGGPRYSHRFVRMTPFVQLLAGAIHLEEDIQISVPALPIIGSDLGLRPELVDIRNSTTETALQAGAGVDIHLTRRLSARLAGDYRRILGLGVNQFRFAAGVAVGVSRR